MENFKVEDMKIGDSFEYEFTDEGIIYTVTKITNAAYKQRWFSKKLEHCTVEQKSALLNWIKSSNFKLLKVDFKKTFKNTFTKSDLISGEYIVETINGKRYLVAGDYLIGNTGHMRLSSYDDCLHHENTDFTINKVFNGKNNEGRICASNGLNSYLHNKDLKIIYDRKENEHRASQEAKLRSLEESIAEQQKEAEKLLEELEL